MNVENKEKIDSTSIVIATSFVKILQVVVTKMGIKLCI